MAEEVVQTETESKPKMSVDDFLLKQHENMESILNNYELTINQMAEQLKQAMKELEIEKQKNVTPEGV